MMYPIGYFRNSACSIALLATIACLPATSAMAERVTLKSSDGGIDISGDFLEYRDGLYIIDTQFGPLRIKDNDITCSGDGCPDATEVAAAPATPQAGTPTVDADGRVVWEVSLSGRPRAFTAHVERLAEEVLEKTEGAFALEIFYGGDSESPDVLSGISEGEYEIAQFCIGTNPELTPALGVLELPFLGVSTLEEEIAVSEAVYAHPAVQADMARWNATLLMPTPQPQYNIVGTDFPPLSLADFDGLVMQGEGRVGEAFATLGVELVSLPRNEVKPAMSSRQLRMASFPPDGHMSNRTLDNATWWTTNLNPGTQNCPVIVNSAAFEALPDAFKDALTSSVDKALEHYLANYRQSTMRAWGPALQRRGIMELTLNDEIAAALDEAVAEPAATAWIAATSEKGIPAQEIYDLAKDIASRR